MFSFHINIAIHKYMFKPVGVFLFLFIINVVKILFVPLCDNSVYPLYPARIPFFHPVFILHCSLLSLSISSLHPYPSFSFPFILVCDFCPFLLSSLHCLLLSPLLPHTPYHFLSYIRPLSSFTTSLPLCPPSRHSLSTDYGMSQPSLLLP